jgi:hypothetical protein
MEQQSSQPGYTSGGAPGGRPGQVTAAAVLLFVLGGLGILLWFLAFIGSLAAASILGAIALILTVVSIIGIVVAALQILAGVRVLGLQASGRKLGVIVSAIGVALAIINLIIGITSGTDVISPIILGAVNALIIFFLQQNQQAFTR